MSDRFSGYVTLNTLLLFFLSVLVLDCAVAPRYTSSDREYFSPAAKEKPLKKKMDMESFPLTGTASYYGHKFHGRKTANGEIFDMHKMTCAHKTLPFDTVVMVTNLENNKQVRVRVNDRGPFVKDRIIDLSLGAAKEIGMVEKGTSSVRLEIIK
ncbi:MAG: septal ring lytic transglycosylase RlpA family protein [bacterium]